MSDKKIAILVDNYFEQAELEQPLDQLKEAGAAVEIIAVADTELQALQHTEKGDTFTANHLIAECAPDDYDILLLPGGVVNADKLRMDETARTWVSHFIDNDKLVAAICHAPWLLVSTDVIEGRRLTSYYTLQDDIRNAGGQWTDQSVVVDGNIVTSRKPDDIPAFVDAIKTWCEEHS